MRFWPSTATITTTRIKTGWSSATACFTATASSRDQLLVMRDGSVYRPAARHIRRGRGAEVHRRGRCAELHLRPAAGQRRRGGGAAGKYIISTKDTIREPRTAIGQVDANHYVSSSPTAAATAGATRGMTLQELQQVFVEQGCRVAYNLDGGGSATMILGSQRVNKTSGSRERDVSDIVYFTK